MLEHPRIQATTDMSAVVRITPVSGRTSLRLKSWLPEYMNGGKIVVLAGRELPWQVGATLSGPIRSLCIGPGEWLIVSHQHPPVRLLEHVESDLPEDGLVLVDLSEELAGLEVRGPAARELLSKGCGLDLHPRAFPAGRCARTRFAQVSLVIECRDKLPGFELYVSRSYFHYLHSWLSDAKVGFGNGLS